MSEHNLHDGAKSDAAVDISDARPGASGKVLFYMLAIPIVVIDQVTKWIVAARMPLNTRYAPFPEIDHFFRFTHVANTGAAFGLFRGGTTFFLLLALIMSIVLVYYNHRGDMPSRILRVALGLVWAGAVGNMIDRVRIGHVTDFIDFDVSWLIDVPLADWPVFNVADMAVVAGIIIMLYLSVFAPEHLEPQHNNVEEQAMTTEGAAIE